MLSGASVCVCGGGGGGEEECVTPTVASLVMTSLRPPALNCAGISCCYTAPKTCSSGTLYSYKVWYPI